MMFQTLFVYILLAFSMFFLLRKSVENGLKMSWSYWLAILLFTLVFGLRYGVGIDYWSYHQVYVNWHNISSTAYADHLEPAFKLLLNLCHVLSLDVVWLFLLTTFLQIFFLALAFRDFKEPFAFMCLVLIFTGVAMTNFMNVIRQNIAFCIFIYAIRFIEKRSFIKYLLFTILAFTFHRSAVILLPVYFVWRTRREWFRNTTVQIVLLLLSFSMIFISPIQTILGRVDDIAILLGYEYHLYDSRIEGKGGLHFTNIFQLLICTIIILQSRNLKNYFQSDYFNILYDLFLLGTYLGYVFFGSMLFGRIILYFTNVTFIMFGFAFAYFFRTWRLSLTNLYSYLLMVVFVGFVFVRLMQHSEDNTTQYVFYFQKELHEIKDTQYEIMMNKRMSNN